MIGGVTGDKQPCYKIPKTGKTGKGEKKPAPRSRPALSNNRWLIYLITNSFMTFSYTAPLSPLALNL